MGFVLVLLMCFRYIVLGFVLLCVLVVVMFRYTTID